MRRAWQLQDAKNRFSEVVDLASREGPQTVTRRGRDIAVIVAVDEYRRLTRPKASFKAFLLSAPRVSLKIERDRDQGRDIELD
jgi:antitoxin Phd